MKINTSQIQKGFLFLLSFFTVFLSSKRLCHSHHLTDVHTQVVHHWKKKFKKKKTQNGKQALGGSRAFFETSEKTGVKAHPFPLRHVPLKIKEDVNSSLARSSMKKALCRLNMQQASQICQKSEQVIAPSLLSRAHALTVPLQRAPFRAGVNDKTHSPC